MPQFKALALIVIGAGLFIGTAVQAQVYRYIDKNGNVVFTDEPHEGAEPIEVREVPTITLPKGKPLTEETIKEAERQQPQGPPYQEIRFQKPNNKTAFWSGSGDVNVEVSAQPALKEGHQFRLKVDGQTIATQTSGSFLIRNMDRGTHQATVAVTNGEGTVVQEGASIEFTIHRPSVQN
ncbi:DUF4124 domain-containing protein [Marinobacteraceae bacterium S3BR75-40.1]